MAVPALPPVAHLRRARDLIDRRYAEPLDLDAMARAAGYSRYHFARAFRVAYGETPRAYLTRRRIEHAQDLLRSANLTVTEIRHLTGFTTDTLGFELRFDVPMGEDYEGCGEEFRWLTVGLPGRPDVEIILTDPRMGHDAETAAQIRELVTKGALGSGVMTTDDCRKTYEELSARGVTFLSEPAERSYGVEAVFRVDSGNWFSLTRTFWQAGG